MKRIFIMLLMSMSFSAHAELVNCTGTIRDFVTRDNDVEATRVSLQTDNGATPWAQIGGHLNDSDNFTGYTDHEKFQLSMLLSAYMSGKTVILELQTGGYEFNSCTDFDNNIPIRYVRLKSS